MHSLEARFFGGPWFNDRSSDPVQLSVSKHTPQFELSVSPSTASVWGQPIELTADVSIPWAPNPMLQSPLGTVTFARVTNGAETQLGQVNITEQSRRAILAVPQLPIGEHELIARFSPSAQTTDRLAPASTDPLPHERSAVPVNIEVQGLNAIIPGESFTRSVMVTEHADLALGERPEGTVKVRLDGTLLGAYPLSAAESSGAGSRISFANVAIPALPAGPHEIEVEYAPAAVSYHAARTATFSFDAGKISPTFTLDVDTQTVGWDEYLWARATATKPGAQFPEPRGTLTVTDGTGDGAGSSCEIAVIPGVLNPDPRCPLFWETAGWRTLSVEFTPDASEQSYGPSVSHFTVPVTVVKRDPGFSVNAVRAAGSQASPTAGENLRLSWSVRGTDRRAPEGDVSFAVHPANAVPAAALDRCDATARTGSCELPLTMAGAAADRVTLTVSHAGDDRFAAASRTASVSPRDCVILDLQVKPAGSGTITAQQSPDCGEPGKAKSGYAEGSVVTFTATPLPSKELSYDWRVKDPVSPVETAAGRGNGLHVTPTRNWAVATFSKTHRCVMVIVDHRSLTGTTGEVRLPGQSGAAGTRPNCGYDPMVDVDSRFQPETSSWSTTGTPSNSGHSRAWYLRGTELTGIQLRPGQDDTKLYALEGRVFGGQTFERSGDRGVSPVTLTNAAQLKVTFGPSCYAATAEAAGPGSLTIRNPENCSEPENTQSFAAAEGAAVSAPGTRGWYAGTVLRYQATPTAKSGDTLDYVKTWAGTDAQPTTTPAAYAPQRFEENAAEQVETATVRAHDPAPHVTAEFASCHLVTIERGVNSNNFMAPQMPEFTTQAQCGHPLATETVIRSTPTWASSDPSRVSSAKHYFDEGTTAGFDTPSDFASVLRVNDRDVPVFATLQGWQLNGGRDPWPSGATPDHQASQQVTVTQPMRVQPHYSLPNSCATSVLLTSNDRARVTVSGKLNNPQQKCNTGTLEHGPGPVLAGKVPGTGSFTTHDSLLQLKSSSLTMTAHVEEGLNPIVGWMLNGAVTDPFEQPQTGAGDQQLPITKSVRVKQATAGRQITMPLGFRDLQAEAVICQQLQYSVNVTREDGTVVEGYDEDDELLMAYPAPNCPFAPNAWTVGTTVELWAFGNPAGYAFTGWSGDTSGTRTSDPVDTALGALLDDDLEEFLGADFPAGAVTVFTMDGTRPTKRIDANYDVRCADVTLRGYAGEITHAPEANCPGFEGQVTTEEYSDKWLLDRYSGTQQAASYDYKQLRKMAGPYSKTMRFIGGTEVAIRTGSISDRVWTGWKGDVVEEGESNPATVLVGANGGDAVVDNSFRGRTTAEKWESFGNDLAIGMKKVAGFMAIAATEYLINYPPLGMPMMMIEGMALMGTLLEMAGVSKDAVAWMGYAKQFTDMLKAPLACLGTWGLGTSSTGGIRGAAGVAAEAGKQQTYRITNITDAATGIAEQQAKVAAGNTGVLTSTKLAYYKGKLGMAKLSKNVMPVATVGIAGYGAVQGTGVKWDDNANDAWTNFDGYTDCVKKSLPKFLQGSSKAEQAVLDYAESMNNQLGQGNFTLQALTEYQVDIEATGDAAAQLTEEDMREALEQMEGGSP